MTFLWTHYPERIYNTVENCCLIAMPFFNRPPVDVRARHDLVWDESLCPVGEGTFEKESFEEWWSRNASKLTNLHPQIVEQWIFRHWEYSPYCHIRLEFLQWRLESWPADRILGEIGHMDNCFDPVADYLLFHGQFSYKEPALTMDVTGNWNYPIVAIEAQSGVITIEKFRSNIHFWLIEGHSRMRYLNALHHRGQANGNLDVFILTL